MVVETAAALLQPLEAEEAEEADTLEEGEAKAMVQVPMVVEAVAGQATRTAQTQTRRQVQVMAQLAAMTIPITTQVPDREGVIHLRTAGTAAW